MTEFSKHHPTTLVLLGSLYILRDIALTFIDKALPAFVNQQGRSLEAIGLLQALPGQSPQVCS